LKKNEFEKIKALLIDLDGTVYFKDQAIAGAADTINYLRDIGITLRFLTNTDAKPSKYILNRINGYGLNISIDEIHTPVSASVKFMKSRESKSFYPLVSLEVLPEYEGMNVNEEKVDYVIIGDFRERVNYQTMNKAFRLISSGAEIIALQKGKYFYNEEGKNIDTGAFVKLFEYASDKEAMVMGKPSKDFFKVVLHELNLKPEEVAIIGDDITTDILGAKQLGAMAILVKTGKYNDNNIEKYSEIEPDLILDTFTDIARYIVR